MQAIDNALLTIATGARDAYPLLRTASLWLSELGSGVVLIALTAIVAAWLIFRGHRRAAAGLVGVTLSGRGGVELLKSATDRARPTDIDPQVVTYSLSFPSGHAANAMIVYLSLALIAAPIFTRSKWPPRAAWALAIVIGLTRPILGAHWPTDVLAGWALGLAWTLGGVWLLRAWIAGQPVGRPPHTP